MCLWSYVNGSVYICRTCKNKYENWGGKKTMHVTYSSMSCFYSILWKESLNSDGQQFHQSQQNEQFPLTTNHWTYERPWHKIGNPGPGLGQA